MVVRFKPPEEIQAELQLMQDGFAKWWSNLTKDEKHARMQLMQDGFAKWWSNLTEDEKRAKMQLAQEAAKYACKKRTAEEREYISQKRMVNGWKKTVASANEGKISTFDVLYGPTNSVGAHTGNKFCIDLVQKHSVEYEAKKRGICPWKGAYY